MPLALLGVGESGTITDIRGKEDVILESWHGIQDYGESLIGCLYR